MTVSGTKDEDMMNLQLPTPHGRATTGPDKRVSNHFIVRLFNVYV